MYNFKLTSLDNPASKEDIKAYEEYSTKFGKTDSRAARKVFNAIAIFLFILLPAIIYSFEGDLSLALVHIAITSAFYYLAKKVINRIAKQINNEYLEQHAKIYKLARDNNLLYLPNPRIVDQDGAIFNIGHTRGISDSLRFKDGTEIANYTYSTGAGKSHRSYHWGYIRLPLKRNIPHILLDSKKNNLFSGSSNLPVDFAKSLKLSLEGNFDNYFTLYAPEQYKTDALYIFTPDVMQAVIDADEKHGYDMEAIDDHFYIYRHGGFNFNKEEEWNIIEYVMNIIHPQITKQAERYSDSNVGNRSLNVVAEPGRRIEKKKRTAKRVAEIIAIILWVIGVLVMTLTGNV